MYNCQTRYTGRMVTTRALANTFITSYSYHFFFCNENIYYLLPLPWWRPEACFQLLQSWCWAGPLPLSDLQRLGSGNVLGGHMCTEWVSQQSRDKGRRDQKQFLWESEVPFLWRTSNTAPCTSLFLALYHGVASTTFPVGPKQVQSFFLTFWFLKSKEARFPGFYLEVCWLSGGGKSLD